MSAIIPPNLSALIGRPYSASGQLVYSTGAGRWTVLPAGTNGYVLTVSSGVPAWVSPAAASGAVPLSTVTTAGDLIVANGSESVTRLGIGSNGQVLAVSGGALTWITPASGGDVVGPASATDHAIARFDTTTGKLIQSSLTTIDDAGNIILPALAEVDGRDVSVDGDKLDSITSVGSGAIITATERTNLGTAFTHSQASGNPHSTSAADVGAPALSTVTAAGSLYVGTGVGTVGELAKGTAGQLLRTDGTATTLEYWTLSVGTTDLVDGAVTTAKLGADAVDGTKIADLAVDSEHIAAGAIDTGHIADAQVTNAKLANMAQATIKGRASGAGTGAPVDLTATQVRTILNVADGADVTADAGAVMEADYNAHTILAATTDDTPVALTVGEQTLVGRITGGNIAALTAAQARVLIAQADALPFEAIGVHPDATVPATLTAPYNLTVASAYVVPIGDVPSVGTATLTVTNVTQTRTIVASVDLVALTSPSLAVDTPRVLTIGSGTAIQADAGDVLRATLVYSSGVLPVEVSGVAQAEIAVILYVVPR